MLKIPLTTIGSFFRFDEDLQKSIDIAIEFQKSYGIDIFSDGEQRADMINYFAEAFEGLSVETGIPIIQDKIVLSKEPKQFSKVKDLEYIKSKNPDLDIKIAVTGPTTLGMSCGSKKIDGYYKNITDPSLYEDITLALTPIVKALIERGARVQIDEPFLSQGFRDLDFRVELLDTIGQGLPPNLMSVHVCGYIGRYGVLDRLLQLQNYSVLSFAFAGKKEKGNIDFIDLKSFEKNDKKLGAGCISVTPLFKEEVDTEELVTNKISEIVEKIGVSNIAYIHPDCGFKATRKELVPNIMRNLKKGVNSFQATKSYS
jgi:methionine synthase II (cobalamin-independent)